jgi:flagellar biosynthetic protein FliR
MTLAFDTTSIVSILLAMTRIITVLVVAPPFRGSTMPNRVRVVLAGAMAFAVAPQHPADIESAFGPVFLAIVYQVVVGALFGFLIQLLLAVPLIAGSMIDGVAGLSAASLFDPMSDSSATPAARLTQLLSSIILVSLGGHLLIMRGVMRTYEAAPLSGLEIAALEPVLVEGAGQLLLAAVEVALPVLVALLLTEAVLALAARAAPRLNVMVVGFAVKSLVFVLTFAALVPLLVHAVTALLERSLRWGMAILGA